MKVETIPASELSTELVDRWTDILSHSRQLDSPYFRPEYVQAVAGVRPHVEIGLLSDGGQIVGFFPFERAQRVIARPVGGRMSDYQGVVAGVNVPWQAGEIMAGCGLKTWEFDHQLAAQQQLAPFFVERGQSPWMDLSEGYDTYLKRRREATTSLVELLRKHRKFQREHDVKFVWHTPDEAAFDQLLRWKSDQYLRSGLEDIFRMNWTVKLLRAIWQWQSPQFAGVLSAMYADGELAAVHFGMRTSTTLHSWFPTYDLRHAKFSPGASQFLFMAQHAAEHGIRTIDFGKGDEVYKLAFATDFVPLGEGAIETRRISAIARRGWRQAKDWVKQTPLREPARASLRWLRNVQQWWKVPQ
jgi:CelD/BcsL family acetyltransferase involved in cellulose biosynthesis